MDPLKRIPTFFLLHDVQPTAKTQRSIGPKGINSEDIVCRNLFTTPELARNQSSNLVAPEPILVEGPLAP
jgi:hypothetical protein